MKKRALLSVFDKEGIAELAAYLHGAGWEIVSTGGTAAYLRENSIPVTDVSELTGFPECLDGRVKTLHPAIHGGLLARRDLASHLETLEQQGIAPIDLVCVNLYPFFEKAQAGLSEEETVEFIDIGGPSMLRSAAKNCRDVIVLTDPADYAATMAGLKSGGVSAEFRKRLAGKVFNLTSAYDGAIARYFLGIETAEPAELPEPSQPPVPADAYPAFWPQSLKKARQLRYGENSHQSAAFYVKTGRPGALGSMEQLQGKTLSYNNIRDLDLAWKAVCAFGLPADHTPPQGEEDVERLLPGYTPKAAPACCVAVKHMTPCGIALGRNLGEAFDKTFACDPVSIFGGILAANAVVDTATAEKLGELFLEIVVAPDFEKGALELLKKKKDLRVMRAPRAPREGLESVSVDGGVLVQETNRKLLEKWEVVTRLVPDPADIPDMLFGMRAVSYVKSNAIVVVKDAAAVGIGGGETNRIWAAELALSRSARACSARAVAADKGGAGAIAPDGVPARTLASDAFFPFPDVAEAAAQAGIKAIIQVGGSVNDKLSIEACDRLGLAMVFTGVRQFKH
ncbi:MAG: bifunctional phosphoribosylaminoimidazolecarboxamide formyltransferase/IMP cyclohydrolase [Treponema sp.]|jgi:phosphoribosylaminoimidazolecarboxamide formyltransferase/IMP cyclohydrolase|nr:bifunctional phosphoribosylaminoimidazolecarboxamide formyltransferase/IMP cyclohydrolase [Treponema sp.]